jgi:transcriptional regulator with XRE-family HTH domain
MKSIPPPPPKRTPPDAELHSPAELDLTVGEPTDDMTPAGYMTFYWEPDPNFPAYLRKCRESAGLTLREASKGVGISLAGLGRLETGDFPKKPNINLLNHLADLYGIDSREMLHHAGIRVQMPEGIDLRAIADRQFEAIFLDSRLRPALMDAGSLQFFSYRMKRAILELIDKLVAQPDPQRLIDQLKQSLEEEE